MNLFLYMYLFTDRCMQSWNTASFFFFYWLFVVRKKKKKTSGSGRVRALNLTVPLGSGRVRRSRVRAGFGLQFKARADLYCGTKSRFTKKHPVVGPFSCQLLCSSWPEQATIRQSSGSYPSGVQWWFPPETSPGYNRSGICPAGCPALDAPSVSHPPSLSLSFHLIGALGLPTEGRDRTWQQLHMFVHHLVLANISLSSVGSIVTCVLCHFIEG